MDISEPEPGFEGRFAVVSASGILFHIVDDPRWARAIGNIVDYLAPNGVAIVGGDFGDRTEEIGVMRKVRSLDAWDQALGRAGGRRVELIRFDWFKGGVNPGLKDNLLAIQRRGDGGELTIKRPRSALRSGDGAWSRALPSVRVHVGGGGSLALTRAGSAKLHCP